MPKQENNVAPNKVNNISKINNIIVAENQKDQQQCNNHHQHPLPIQNNIDNVIKLDVAQNSMQDHLIQRLSEQVKGLEDKQDVVKKGDGFTYSNT